MIFVAGVALTVVLGYQEQRARTQHRRSGLFSGALLAVFIAQVLSLGVYWALTALATACISSFALAGVYLVLERRGTDRR